MKAIEAFYRTKYCYNFFFNRIFSYIQYIWCMIKIWYHSNKGHAQVKINGNTNNIITKATMNRLKQDGYVIFVRESDAFNTFNYYIISWTGDVYEKMAHCRRW